MAWVAVRVAVDFGTSSTCVVMSTNHREPQVVAVDGNPLLSSAVYAAADGTLFVGQEADRQAAVDPSRYEPHPKRRIDEGELLLGATVLPVLDVVRAVLTRAVNEARRLAGGAAVDQLVLTHPADWGAVRTRLLRQAGAGLAGETALVPEPVAAAVYHAATFAVEQVNQHRTVEFSEQPGDAVAVLDLGGGTVDASVVRRVERAAQRDGRGGFQVLATRGDPTFGGADIDQALLEHVGSVVSRTDDEAWSTLVQGRELADRRSRRVLRQDVRGSKETLSRHVYTDVPMPSPFADAHVTRADLERLIAVPLSRTVELTRAVIAESGMRPAQLSAIFLVGGSSRIPMIARLAHERLGVLPTTLDQPETVVATGALRAVPVEPGRATASTGPAARTAVLGRPGMPPSSPAAQPAGPPPVRNGSVQRAPHGGYPAAPRTPRRRRPAVWWSVAGAVLLVAAVVVGSIVLLAGDQQPRAAGTRFAQFHYSFVAPAGWVQTEDNVAARQVVVKPATATSGDDLIVVQERELSYHGAQRWRRFVRELRADIRARPAQRYTDFNGDARYAGKRVVSFTEHKPKATVTWYALAGGTSEVLVGCQYATARDRVMTTCRQVVRTLEIRQ